MTTTDFPPAPLPAPDARLFEMARTDEIVHASLQAHRRGLPLVDALTAAVLHLAEWRRLWSPEATRAVMRQPPPAIVLAASPPPAPATPLPPPAAPTGTARVYLIRCIDDSGQQEMALWWRPERMGYTTSIDEAGRYTREEAESQARSRNCDFAVPLSKAMELSSRVVRAGRFVELAPVAAPPPPPAEHREGGGGDAQDYASMLRAICACDCGCGQPVDENGERCPMCSEACGPASPAPAVPTNGAETDASEAIATLDGVIGYWASQDGDGPFPESVVRARVIVEQLASSEFKMRRAVGMQRATIDRRNAEVTTLRAAVEAMARDNERLRGKIDDARRQRENAAGHIEAAGRELNKRSIEAHTLRARVAELEAARRAYASEFPPNAEGEPDVGSIHANIRRLKGRIAELEADNATLDARLLEAVNAVPTIAGKAQGLTEAEIAGWTDAERVAFAAWNESTPDPFKWTRREHISQAWIDGALAYLNDRPGRYGGGEGPAHEAAIRESAAIRAGKE